MTDIVVRAKEARQKLSTALSLLQSPEAGTLIDTVAEPVAQAMGALHSIESTGGANAREQAPLALNAVRAALAALQAAGSNPAGDLATASIAGSLGLVHSLAQDSVAPPAAAPQPAAPQPAAPQPAAVQPTAVQPAPRQPEPARTEAAQASALDATQLAGSRGVARPQVEAPRVEPPYVEPPRVESSGRERKNSKHASSPPAGMPAGATQAEANLGAHSPTNFYKGLSGNDVVDDGGLFVATYKIPSIGTKLWVTVNMPGGYEFQALAEVKWTRETGVGDAPPGYGCAFESISDAARKLIYRYVKNREPLFHDDL